MGRYRLSLNALLEAEKLSKNPDWNLDYLIGKSVLANELMERNALFQSSP